MGHGLACLPGSGWAVLAILTYYVYAPVAARCPPATCLPAPPTALCVGVGGGADGL